MADIDWSEHYIRRGDPSKPTYYIIRQKVQVGLFALYKIFASHIAYALTNGWIPVVDLQNYPNAYLPPEKLGKENAWEYYFEQPFHIGLEQAYNGDNIILSRGEVVYPMPYEVMVFLENRYGILSEWRMLSKLGLLKVKPALVREALSIRKELFAPNERVLGVHLRGTDYNTMRPYNHPIQPPVEFAVSKTVELLPDWNCDKIFLATEDESIADIFKDFFKENCVTLDRAYIDYKDGDWITSQRIDRANDHFLQGKEYLMEIILLSTCTSFIGSRNSGSVGVMMFADKFEHTYFFNLGRYGMVTLD